MKLTEQKAQPVLKGATAFPDDRVKELMSEIPLWSREENMITREFRFRDFREAMDFTNRVAALANEEDHHPDITISYNKVRVTLTTHKVHGLTLNDFIVAAKIDALTDSRG
ncbi:MAG TPA: 4a-hydroxytetrahydrobiopterin dehydratase [Nitrospirota bacterium]|nr:4a-hydroxytetrahydrobiopterin dehydratase [Nitrospirota bacterium]